MEKLLNNNGSEERRKSNAVFNIVKKSISSGRLLEFEVVSNCMSPFLSIGDKVTIGNLILKKLRLGDIVVYRRNDSFYVHRYIYTLKKHGRFIGLISKADNCFDFDPYLVSIEQVVGKVITINRQDIKINLENFPWEEITYLIGILSFAQAFIIKALRYFKSITFRKTPFPFSKQIIASPFSISIKSITVLAYLNKKISSHFF